MKKLAIGTAKTTGKALGYMVTGGFLTVVIVAIVVLERRSDLDVWHKARLDEEFTRKSAERTLEEYVALEDRLFAQVEEEVYEEVADEDLGPINRFHRGSLSDPARWPTNWNRTFEWPAESAKAGVLLLHGMSDSPYSLRRLGALLHEQGAWVVGLRMPGHGTAPSGLIRVQWEDMAAAVRLGAHHLRARIGSDVPLVFVGYSNGGALAVEYALRSLEDESLPRVDRLVLISPAIGVTPAAALAVWQGRLGRWLGFEKLAWNSISLEYDPFKYGSFAVNAGTQSHRISAEIREKVDALSRRGELASFPPVLAFQSAVDATVSVPALIEHLFAKLPDRGHELVLFDINRVTEIEHLLVNDPKKSLGQLLASPDRAFTVSVVTNVDESSDRVVQRRRGPGTSQPESIDLGMAWPGGMYSLSHVALPFPEDDPLYGRAPAGDEAAADNHITLGSFEFRGERGALGISSSDMLRQRWNPFWPMLAERVTGFVFGRPAGGDPTAD